jgi:hypothetical protein
MVLMYLVPELDAHMHKVVRICADTSTLNDQPDAERTSLHIAEGALVHVCDFGMIRFGAPNFPW